MRLPPATLPRLPLLCQHRFVHIVAAVIFRSQRCHTFATFEARTNESMNAKAINNAALKDAWTHDPDYRRCFQTADDIRQILDLLALEKASGLADIGCGNGAFAIAAAQSYPQLPVWAFDALDSAVAECRRQANGLPNLQAEIAWAQALPLPDARVDRVLFRSVLHHIAEPRAVYEEISRILKPGGRTVLQVPCNYWDSAFGQVLSDLMMLADDSHRRFYYQPAQIVAGLQKAGLTPGQPECWTYPFSFIDDRQARFLRQHQAQEKLRLRRIEPGKWSIKGYWTRIVAEKL